MITALLDDTIVCFHKDMDELIHEHPPRETEPECIVVWLLFKAHSGEKRAARLWQEYFRNEALMSAGWNAEAMEPDVYHKADDLNNDDASLYGHGDDCVPRRERDEGAQSEHQSVDNQSLAKIVKQVSSWKLAAWVRVGLKAAALTPNTAANTSDELSWGSS